MNQQLQDYARNAIKEGLAKLSGRPHEIFKLMYARDNGKRSVADALARDINEVVDSMPTDTLDHAMNQVNRTIADNLGKDTGV